MWDSNPVYADITTNPMWETWGSDPLFTESAHGDIFIGFRCAADATE